MYSLPQHEHLPTDILAQCFNDTTNSYKFYWFLSILDHLQHTRESVIRMEDLSLRMLANVWYPLVFFKLSFGKSDSFKSIAEKLTAKIPKDNSINAPSLLVQMDQHLIIPQKEEVTQSIIRLLRYVPTRFQRPFFKSELRGVRDQKINNKIIKLANQSFSNWEDKKVIYRYINNDKIEIHSTWIAYFQKNQSILRGFINWHLVKFLQKNNPNVIGLTEKLYKPLTRNLSFAKKFWASYIEITGGMECIYSKKAITKDFSLDHFIPWSYVAHDELWNIIPTHKEVNSSKGNNLPDLHLYLDAFVEVQFNAFNAIHKSNLHNKSHLLESYFCLLKSEETQITSFGNSLKERLFPLFQSARNLGFSEKWRFNP